MIVLLRGHIRNSLETNELYMFLKLLHSIHPLTIYIHTWGVKQNSISWRRIHDDARIVTEDIITTYFRELTPLIKYIRIDPDRSIPLIGDLSGNIAKSLCPKIGWKQMWSGIHTLAQHILTEQPTDALVLNTRFDLFKSPAVFRYREFIDLYTNSVLNASSLTRIQFLISDLFNGCDNFYIGTVSMMASISSIFYNELDRIMDEHPLCLHPEHLVMIEATRMMS